MKVKKVLNTAVLVLGVFSTQLAFSGGIITNTETITCGALGGTCCNPDIGTCATGTQQFATTSGKVTVAANDEVIFNLGCESNNAINNDSIVYGFSGGVMSCQLTTNGPSSILTCHNSSMDSGHVWVNQFACLVSS